AGLSAEARVEADLLSAKAQFELGNRADAGRMLDALLNGLAPDHWRRREIMSLRFSVLATEEEREAMLKAMGEGLARNPAREGAVLDYAELLVAAERRSEAAALLVESAAALPQ